MMRRTHQKGRKMRRTHQKGRKAYWSANIFIFDYI